MHKGFLSAMLAALLVLGCAGPSISYFQLQALNKGMGPSEVSATLKQQPLDQTPVKAGERMFIIQRYFMSSAVATDPYFLAYENERLAYWGTISEFRRHPDAGLTNAFNQALPLLPVVRK